MSFPYDAYDIPIVEFSNFLMSCIIDFFVQHSIFLTFELFFCLFHETFFRSKKSSSKQTKNKKSSDNLPQEKVDENKGSDDDDDERNEDKSSKTDGAVDNLDEDEAQVEVTTKK